MLQVPRQFTLEQRAMGLLRGAVNFAGRVGGAISSLNPWGPTLDEVHDQMDRDFAEAAEEYGDSVDFGLQLSMALIPGPKGSRAAEATGRGNIIRVRPGEAPVRLTPRVPEPPPATMGEPGPKATLELARRIADVERPPMNNKRTVSVLETHEGPTVVGGGKTDLSPAQAKLAEELGLVVAPPRPTRHAEPTAILGAKELGYTPKRGVTTNIICAGSADSCAVFIESEGGTVTGKRTYEFPGR